MRTLNDIMEFDHVIEVKEDGSIIDRSDIYAPELYDEHVSSPWRLLRGWTGQYGYNGPIMHPSEFIGGRLEDHIRETPGVYVALVEISTDDNGNIDDGEGGWAIAYLDTSSLAGRYIGQQVYMTWWIGKNHARTRILKRGIPLNKAYL